MSGIQSLLKTEKEAQEIVSQARQYRAQKLKDAKSDAQKEIEQYRLKKEAELKKYEEEFQGSNQKLEREAEEQVKDELANIKKTCESKKENVIKLLIDAVISPKPDLHINAKQ
ncbi:hypothetical protein HPODL_04742 [Ogataea parapolymorpha DL-1]|uniref:V-type proton ATPase subunit G n=1 Tax=Ogataea parapolymorpha (strain ATCC 26012 / BCRC 20466 / JCM 22074 / NRRL Y-7560 / DL-1) TaxID=871575 RepID=W1QJF1_OGAPD|nr:hypothetical protein HPODL_04742 [Ogataea parapolymorpha DL-1]ESX01977.1 hypothetical protein HPODL_04742 [Ogataea parapolymorpha DL-1]